jgi:hypothetical protein
MNNIGSLGKNNAADNVSNVVVDGVFLNASTNGLRVKTWQVIEISYLTSSPRFCCKGYGDFEVANRVDAGSMPAI